MPYGTVNADKMTTSDGVSSSGLYGFKNRIINGAMVINQRAGDPYTATGSNYCLDRWQMIASVSSKFTVSQNAGSVTPPTGYTKYLGVTSSAATSLGATDYYLITQKIEGFNIADLGWGAAGASPITVSFWVRSSLTGTFGFVTRNGAGSRVYPASYTISSANTWEQKSVTIAGDTTGTWSTDNSTGIELDFGLGVGSTYSNTAGTWTTGGLGTTGATSVVGTNGATFYITGVQLEKGSTATSFDYRSYGDELMLCQRYYEKSYNVDVVPATALAVGWSSLTLQNISEGPSGVIFKVTKRANPTMVMYNAVSGASGAMYRASDAASVSATFDYIGTNQVGLVRPASSSANSYYIHWTASIEL
jgi:hypothetical protein